MKTKKTLIGICQKCGEEKEYEIEFLDDGGMICHCPVCKSFEKFPTQNRLHAMRALGMKIELKKK